MENQARGKEKENQHEKKEATRLNPKRIPWDYPNPLRDDLWRARRMAEFFPFVLEELTEEDRKILLRQLDEINVPDERKEFIRMVCGEKQNTD